MVNGISFYTAVSGRLQTSSILCFYVDHVGNTDPTFTILVYERVKIMEGFITIGIKVMP